jgi:hypothetical protein
VQLLGGQDLAEAGVLGHQAALPSSLAQQIDDLLDR